MAGLLSKERLSSRQVHQSMAGSRLRGPEQYLNNKTTKMIQPNISIDLATLNGFEDTIKNGVRGCFIPYIPNGVIPQRDKTDRLVCSLKAATGTDITQSLFEAVKAFVLEHQGKKGFINTSNDSKSELIWTLEFDNDNGGDPMFAELIVAAVRVKDGNLEILYNRGLGLDDEEIAEECEGNDAGWTDIYRDNSVIFLNTLFSIAENIEDFVD